MQAHEVELELIERCLMYDKALGQPGQDTVLGQLYNTGSSWVWMSEQSWIIAYKRNSN